MKHEQTSQPQATDTAQSVTLENPAPAEGEKKRFTRRTFMKLGAGAAGLGLVVGVGYQHRFALLLHAMEYAANRHFDARAFIVIPPKGKIQLICHRSEMGQGVRTAMPMLLAEELNVAFENIEVVQALGDPQYGSQNTDGSRSIRNFYGRLREAAAATRELLVIAAAQRWQVAPEQCTAEDGVVRHKGSKRSYTYNELAPIAAKMPMPENPKLKKFKDFRIIGKARHSIDLDDIVQGKANFGADIDLPGMVYACAVRAPVPKAKLKHFDARAARKIRGVLDVVSIPGFGAPINSDDAVCVIADNTWAAINGQRAVKAEWDTAGLKLDDTKGYTEELKQALQHPAVAFGNVGNVDAAEKAGGEVYQAEYHTPFLVHAPMEPLVCVAHVKGDTCEVWAPNQDPQRARKAIAAALHIDFDKITFHVTFLGGGFGRKSQPDFVVEAVALSQKIGKPVRLQWTREDEVKHGFYHAQSFQRLRAALDPKGFPRSWRHQTVFPSMMTVMMPKTDTPWIFEVGMGATNIPYRVKHFRCEAGSTQSGRRVGWLRSVANLWHAFTVNSFVDELAAKANMDPYEYRVKLIGTPRVIPRGRFDPIADYPQDTGRLLAVMRKTHEAFGWDRPLPKGHGKGFANHYSFLSYVAMAIEASVEQGTVKVHRAVCTIDCGLAVNPDSVRAQIEGSVAFGLSAAIHGKITTAKGVVQQNNFYDYPVLRMNEMPKVEIHIINGDTSKPTGVGEPGVPVVPPALTAAIFSATGQRIRNLPVKDHLKSS